MVLPAVASSNSPQDIRAALGMTDERIARERPGPGGMARYEYVKCVYQNRLNQLSGVVPPPSPGPDSTRNDLTRGNGSTGRARVRPKYTVGDDYAAGLFQQSIGEAEANSNDPSAAQRIAGNNQRRLEEIDQLTNSIVERSQRNAENVLSLGTAIIGAQAQAQSTYIPPKSTYEPRYTGCIASEDVCEQIRTGLPPSRNRPSSSMEGGGGKQSGGVGSSAPAPYTLGYAADRNWRPPAGASCRSPSQSMMRDTDGAIWCR